MRLVMNSVRVAVVNALRGANAPMTLGQLSEMLGVEVKSGTVNAMVTAGVLVKAGEVRVARPATREVNAYVLGSVTEFTDKVKATDLRVAVLNALGNAENPMTLADLTSVLGTAVKSGTVNTLVNADMVAVAGTVKVPTVKNVTVTAYALGDNVDNVVNAE